ncbi:MAG: hypothetical protein Q4A10_06395 [Aerococcaceae bacterium]|nr:hypothetical protein [Aerococcaceae bacterium]
MLTEKEIKRIFLNILAPKQNELDDIKKVFVTMQRELGVDLALTSIYQLGKMRGKQIERQRHKENKRK